MSFLSRLVLSAACLLGTLPALAQGLFGQPDAAKAPEQMVQAQLLALAPAGAAPGAQVWVGLEMTHQPGWHTYWKNSGDSGQPTELQWTLPAGVSAGEIQWPTPRKFPIAELANYGYDGTVLLPVPLQIDPAFLGSHIDVSVYAQWLACRKECVPEEGTFSVRIPVQGSTALHAASFEAARQAAPQALADASGSARPEASALRVEVQGLPAAWQGRTLEFFPETAGLIQPGMPWQQGWDGARWSAQVPLSPQRSDSPTELPLVLALADPPDHGPGLPGVRLQLPVQGAWPATASAQPAALSPELQRALAENAARAQQAPAGGASALGLGAALLGALIGGLILNLMPCVFPVLAIKVLAFALHANDRAAHRRAGLAYTAGVVLSFLALGGLLLALRSAGEAIGWGFQLQDPLVVAALATLFTLIGLNLVGLFEFGSVLPSSLASLQARNPTADAFLTGVLAVAIASPCTAPFMGASLGLAIALPAWQALAVFALLGLGMALPYLAASWWPAVARALPRPGAWMNTFRQLMAFPMFATVVWLLWVLGQQSGIDGAAALLMLLVVLAWLVWALGLRGRSRALLGLLSGAALIWLGTAVGPHITRPAPVAALGATADAEAGAVAHWEPWTAQRMADLQAEGRTVFVDYTAAWCVTCQYNKRTTFADAQLLQDFQAKGVVLLRADWTRRDPAITAALARLGRNGVPAYAFYRQGQVLSVLPEMPSVDEVRAVLAGL